MGFLTNENLYWFAIFFPVILLSVAIHEFAHCWTTDRLGDDTPRRAGRVTLNPLVHLDPMGTVMMVVAAMAHVGFGWGRPSPFNPANFRHPARDRMLTALAGPLSNILQLLAWASLGLLFVKLWPYRGPEGAIWAREIALSLCYAGVVVNAVLAIFNLLPVYPLDGHHILSFFAPNSWRPVIDNPAWGLLFLVLVFSGAARTVIGPLIDGALLITYALVGWPKL